MLICIWLYCKSGNDFNDRLIILCHSLSLGWSWVSNKLTDPIALSLKICCHKKIGLLSWWYSYFPKFENIRSTRGTLLNIKRFTVHYKMYLLESFSIFNRKMLLPKWLVKIFSAYHDYILNIEMLFLLSYVASFVY